MNRKEVYTISIANYKFNRIVNSIAGLLKEWSYKYSIRKKMDFKKFKRDRTYHQAITRYYRQYGLKKVDCYWHDLCKDFNGLASEKYIPDYIYHRYIEPKFNKIIMAHAYSDKNTYQRFEDLVRIPKALIYNMNGIFYNGCHQEISRAQAIQIIKNMDQDYLIKPSIDSGGGKNIALLSNKNGELFVDRQKKSIEDLLKQYHMDYSIQEIYKQVDYLSRVNPNAMNSIRVYTMRMDDKILYMDSYIRFGINDALVDNTVSGGVFCRIESDGNLSKEAYDGKYRAYEEHPQSKIKFQAIKITQFDQIKEKAQLMHKKLPHFKFVSWDLGIDEHEEICLIEVNLKHQNIIAFQLLNGPVFGDYTDQILKETFHAKA
ncbi:hypothetical protein SANA_28700 [Gottschalkiaceae bacterium SANA]|nr:hypothetical protein SANA_28700 [Gottschalkiaceae bacterium SANA]